MRTQGQEHINCWVCGSTDNLQLPMLQLHCYTASTRMPPSEIANSSARSLQQHESQTTVQT
jgi:hypothetical protein